MVKITPILVPFQYMLIDVILQQVPQNTAEITGYTVYNYQNIYIKFKKVYVSVLFPLLVVFLKLSWFIQLEETRILCNHSLFVTTPIQHMYDHGRNHMVVWSTTTCAISQCLSPLQLWVRILLMARCSQYSIMW